VNRQLAKDLALARRIVLENPGEIEEIDEYGIGLAHVAEGDRTVYRTEGWRRAELDKALKRKVGEEKKESKRNDSDERGKHDSEKTAEKKERHKGSDPAWSWKSKDRSYCLAATTVRASGRALLISVAQDDKPIRQSLKTLVLMLLIGFPLTLGLATIGGYFLAGRLLRPVGAMASKAQEITAERLSERLPVANPHDEFGRLATVFNSTLERLENSFEQLRRFTADASHELRTPLTAIRSVGEVALQEPLDPAACRDVIGSMLEEADRLARLVDNLLVLTRADSGRVQPQRRPLDLAALVKDVADCLGVLAEEKKQTLTVEAAESLIVEADRETLRLALINLLDNAIKYTPAEGHIRIVVKRQQDEAVVEISDDGPGIPVEHREKIFERFYRIEKGRSSETGGAGLGLAIARWAVELNGGRIELESEEGRGSTFRVVFRERKGGGME
jgi:heavy metal sensor kinase